jgi:hypothetical protein
MRKKERSGPGIATLAPVTGASCGTSGDFAVVEVSEAELDEESSAAL